MIPPFSPFLFLALLFLFFGSETLCLSEDYFFSLGVLPFRLGLILYLRLLVRYLLPMVTFFKLLFPMDKYFPRSVHLFLSVLFIFFNIFGT